MGRLNLRTVLGFTAVLITASLLSACGELAVFVDDLDDQVKTANDRYLEIASVYPEQNSWFVNPGQDIQITFDRDVDVEEALEHIRIVDSQNIPWELAEDDIEFSETTHTLTLKPYPYLDDSRQYTISVDSALTARDGTVLRTPYAWSFSTGTYPKGYFLLHDEVTSTGTMPGYSTSTVVPLEIVTSNAVDYFISTSPIITADFSSLTWQALTSLSGNLGSLTGDSALNGVGGLAYDLGDSPQGKRNIYMMFRDDSTPVNYTPIEVEATFLDSIAPSVDAAGDVGPVNSASTQNGSGSDSGSGIASYTWTASSADVTISSPSSAVSVFLGPDGTDAVYTITLTAADKAGNTASDSFSLDWDTEIPSPPTVTSSSSMTTDTTPTWTWTSSASSDAEDAYQRKLDSGNWVSTPTASFTPPLRGALDDGKHVLYVRQYDDAGNLSEADSFAVVVNTAEISPYDTQIGVSASVILDWPITTLATYGYTLQKYYKYTWTQVSSGTSTASNSGVLSLDSFSSYRWYYSVIIGKTTTQFGPYYFTTVK